MTSQLLLCGGAVVLPGEIKQQDILIEDARILAAGAHLAGDAPQATHVDINGLTVFPGLIDVHVHLREPGGEHKEDLYTGTCAALAGGVTTVLAMPNTDPPITHRESLQDVLASAAARTVCDYGFYLGGTLDNAEEAAAIPDAIGLKLYIGSSTGSLLVDQLPAQIAHFAAYPRDRIIAVHAEDEAAVQYYAGRGQRRPPMCATLATAHVIALAEHFERRLHVCHVSTAYELALIRNARARGLDVTCEVTPHHLFLSMADEQRLGALGQVNPPLRSPEAVDALWAQLDVVDMIATDHAPHTLDEKNSASPPSGMPGMETMLPLLLDAAYHGRLSLPDIARLTSTRPAEVFGLANKGRIAPGHHADLTLVNLNHQWTIQNEGLFTRCGWTPFAGLSVHGKVEQVYLRGKQVFDGDQILAQAGDGCLVLQG
ncbi:MAG: dihydroorotase family protein [Anaerolineae bacterium]|nr:dihydroorotase family protein [Anaerolineae bacterium]